MHCFHRIFLPVWTQNELASAAAGSVGGEGELVHCFAYFAQAAVSAAKTILLPEHLESALVSFASEHLAVSFFAAVRCGTEHGLNFLLVERGVAAAVGTSDAAPACVQSAAASSKDCCYEGGLPVDVAVKVEGADCSSDSAPR